MLFYEGDFIFGGIRNQVGTMVHFQDDQIPEVLQHFTVKPFQIVPLIIDLFDQIQRAYTVPTEYGLGQIEENSSVNDPKAIQDLLRAGVVSRIGHHLVKQAEGVSQSPGGLTGYEAEAFIADTK